MTEIDRVMGKIHGIDRAARLCGAGVLLMDELDPCRNEENRQ